MPKHLSRLTAQDQVLTANDLFDPENRPHGKVMALAETKSLVDHSTQAHIFATKAELDAFVAEQSALSEGERTVKVGDNLYITDTGVPDYWWMGEAPWISELETGAVKVNVDTSLDNTSVNPVANATVTSELNTLGATVAGLEESKVDAQMVSSVGYNTGVDASDESQTANLPDYDNITWGIGTLASYGCTGARVKPKKVTLFRKANTTANSEGSLWFRILRYKDGAWYVAYRANVYVTHGSYTRKGQPIVHTMEYVAGSEFIPVNERVVFCYANAKDGAATNIHNFGAKVVNVSPDAGVTTNASSLPSSPSATGSATYELAVAIEYDKYVSIDEILTTCHNVAIGNGAKADPGGVSIGEGTCTCYDGVAIGVRSVTSWGVAVGSDTYTDSGGVAVGASAKSFNYGIAVGDRACACGDHVIAIGYEAKASRCTPIVIGSACFESTVQITVSEDGVLKVGGKPVGGGGGGGFDPNVYNIAIGADSMVDDYAVAVGYSTRACQNGVAIGQCAIASSETVAIGCGSLASDVYSVAVGGCASAKMCSAVAIGASASAGWRAVAMGACANGSGSRSVVVGYGANACDAGTAIGPFASSDARGVAIGNSAKITKGTYDAGASVVIGNEAQTIYSSAVAVGANSAADDSAVAVGRFSVAGQQSIAIGNGASTVSSGGSSVSNIAIGFGAVAYCANSITIGNEIGNSLESSAMLSAFNKGTGAHAFLRIIAGNDCTDTFLELGRFDTLSGGAKSYKIPLVAFACAFEPYYVTEDVAECIVGGNSMYGYNGY